MSNSLKIRYAQLSIILLFAIITMLQLFSFPGQFAHMRKLGKIELIFEIWLVLLVGIWLLSAQFGLLCLWKILAQITSKTLFDPISILWLSRLVKTFKYALFVGIALLLTIALQADDPGAPVLLTALILFISTLYISSSLLLDQVKLKRD
jgi:hypothetical protein